MPASAHVFIHPWLTPEERWGSLFVSYAGDSQHLPHLGKVFSSDDAAITRQTCFVPLSPETPMADLESWPKEQTVFLLDAASAAPERLQEKAGELRNAQFQVGLLADPLQAPPSAASWDYLFLETSQARTLPAIKLDILATQTRLALNGIRNRHDFDWGTSNNMQQLSAEFLLMRSKETAKPDMTRLNLLQLLSLVSQDADTGALEEIFRKEPKLSYSLLRLVNSAALNLRTPVNSFAQAIALLGRRQLQRWLQLLVYADPGNDQRINPLLQWAAMRGRLMELSLPQISPACSADGDAAFMAGTFSLLDVLLNLPMEEILAQLPIADEIKAALLERSGPLGELLSAIEAADHRRTEAASKLLTGLGITAASHIDTQIAAIDWAGKVAAASS